MKGSQVDGLVNVASGLGTEKSKRSHNHFAFDMLNSWRDLEAAYQSNWIAKRICDIPAEDSTREWRRIKADGAEAIEDAEKALGVRHHVLDALRWSRLYGGAGILMVTDQDMEKPLRPDAIRRGGLKRLIVFDRWDMSPDSINSWDILAPNYLQPDFYRIRAGTQRIHWTHFALFRGMPLPKRWMEHTQGWGDSYLRSCIADVMDTVAAKDGIAELMQEANIDVLQRQELSDELASDQDEQIIKRYQLFSQMKSSINMALLDGSEELQRHTLSLSGVAPIIEQFMTWISAASRMPVTKLFGTSAKGMSATGEGDEQNYNQTLRSIQSCDIDPPLRVLDEVMVRSALGSFPESYDYEWNPLDTPNTLEVAQARHLDAQRHQMYLDSDVATRPQVMRELQSNEVYQYDPEELDELEKLDDSGLIEPQPDDDETRERYQAMAEAGLSEAEILKRL